MSHDIVYTYYEPALDSAEQEQRIRDWQGYWRRLGWRTLVLGRETAEKHPRFAEFLELVASLPTVNPKAYEVACWVRWVAFAAAGGGIMVDYDLVPLRLRPGDIEPGPPTVHDVGRVPCFVSADGAGAERIIETMFAFDHRAAFTTVNERAHYSDMSFFQQIREWSKDVRCIPYGSCDWKNALAVHFSAGACARHSPGLSRVEAIRQAMGFACQLDG